MTLDSDPADDGATGRATDLENGFTSLYDPEEPLTDPVTGELLDPATLDDSPIVPLDKPGSTLPLGIDRNDPRYEHLQPGTENRPEDAVKNARFRESQPVTQADRFQLSDGTYASSAEGETGDKIINVGSYNEMRYYESQGVELDGAGKPVHPEDERVFVLRPDGTIAAARDTKPNSKESDSAIHSVISDSDNLPLYPPSR